MRISGKVALNRSLDGRWYVVDEDQSDLRPPRMLGNPEGYESHQEASRWRVLYTKVGELQKHRG